MKFIENSDNKQSNSFAANRCISASQDTMENVFKESQDEDSLRQVWKEFDQTIKVLSLSKTALNKYLVELDNSRKVVCEEPRNKFLADQAELYTREILREVENLDPRFKSTFLQSGSFYDEVKVGLPDEYDYMAKLELLSKPAIGKAVPTKLGFARMILEDQEAIGLWEELLCEDVDEDEKKVWKNVLKIIDLEQEFRSLVMKAMKIVPMPLNWQRNPCPERHGPCAMLQFLVDGFLPEGQLYISIDLAPCITYPNYEDVEFPYYKYFNEEENAFASLLAQIVADEREVLLVPFIKDGLKRDKDNPYIYHPSYRHQMRVSFSLVEKAVFGHFACNSVEKRLLRILKILRDVYLTDDGKLNERDEPWPVDSPSTKIQLTAVQTYRPAPQPAWFWDYLQGRIGYEDGESPIQKEDISVVDLLQTYVFKSLFFHKKICPNNPECWKEENLSGVLLECLETLFNVYSVPEAIIPNFFFSGNTGNTDSKREKILRRILKVALHLKEQISLP